MSVAERPQSRVLVVPHQIPPEARRTKKNAASDQVRSFAAKRAPSAETPSVRYSATLTGSASMRTTLSRNLCCYRLALSQRQHETVLRQGCKCRCERPRAGCTISQARHKPAFPRAHHRCLYSATVVLQKRRGRSRQSSPPVHRQTKCWPASRLDESDPSGELRVVLLRSGCRGRAPDVRAAGPAIL